MPKKPKFQVVDTSPSWTKTQYHDTVARNSQALKDRKQKEKERKKRLRKGKDGQPIPKSPTMTRKTFADTHVTLTKGLISGPIGGGNVEASSEESDESSDGGDQGYLGPPPPIPHKPAPAPPASAPTRSHSPQLLRHALDGQSTHSDQPSRHTSGGHQGHQGHQGHRRSRSSGASAMLNTVSDSGSTFHNAPLPPTPPFQRRIDHGQHGQQMHHHHQQQQQQQVPLVRVDTVGAHSYQCRYISTEHGSCNNRQITGSTQCEAHTCTALGCTNAKSSRQSQCGGCDLANPQPQPPRRQSRSADAGSPQPPELQPGQPGTDAWGHGYGPARGALPDQQPGPAEYMKPPSARPPSPSPQVFDPDTQSLRAGAGGRRGSNASGISFPIEQNLTGKPQSPSPHGPRGSRRLSPRQSKVSPQPSPLCSPATSERSSPISERRSRGAERWQQVSKHAAAITKIGRQPQPAFDSSMTSMARGSPPPIPDNDPPPATELLTTLVSRKAPTRVSPVGAAPADMPLPCKRMGCSRPARPGERLCDTCATGVMIARVKSAEPDIPAAPAYRTKSAFAHSSFPVYDDGAGANPGSGSGSVEWPLSSSYPAYTNAAGSDYSSAASSSYSVSRTPSDWLDSTAMLGGSSSTDQDRSPTIDDQDAIAYLLQKCGFASLADVKNHLSSVAPNQKSPGMPRRLAREEPKFAAKALVTGVTTWDTTLTPLTQYDEVPQIVPESVCSFIAAVTTLKLVWLKQSPDPFSWALAIRTGVQAFRTCKQIVSPDEPLLCDVTQVLEFVAPEMGYPRSHASSVVFTETVVGLLPPPGVSTGAYIRSLGRNAHPRVGVRGVLEAIKVLFDSIVTGPGIANLGIAIAVIRPPETYTIIKNKSPKVYFRDPHRRAQFDFDGLASFLQWAQVHPQYFVPLEAAGIAAEKNQIGFYSVTPSLDDSPAPFVADE